MMENPALESLMEEIQMNHKWDTSTFLQALLVLEIRELNRNLQHIDLSLLEIVKNG